VEEIILNQIETFFQTLKKWNESTPHQGTDYNTLLFMLQSKIGEKSKTSELLNNVINSEEMVIGLNERINYLINEEKIDESFLITGLINEVSLILESRISDHGELIALYTSVQKAAGSQIIGDKLNELLSLQHHLKAENDLYFWELIVAEKLSKSQRKQWRKEIQVEKSKKVSTMIDAIPTTVLNNLNEIPFGKLVRMIPFEELKNLDENDVRKLKEKAKKLE